MFIKCPIFCIVALLLLQACGSESSTDNPLSLAQANTAENNALTSVSGLWQVANSDDSSATDFWLISEDGQLTTYNYLADPTALDENWAIQHCYVRQSNTITVDANQTLQVAGPFDQPNNYSGSYELIFSGSARPQTVVSVDAQRPVMLDRIEDASRVNNLYQCPVTAPDLSGFHAGRDAYGTRWDCSVYSLLNSNEPPRKINMSSMRDSTGNPFLTIDSEYYYTSYSNGFMSLGSDYRPEYHDVAFLKSISFNTDLLKNDRMNFVFESNTIDATTYKPERFETYHCNLIDRATDFVGLWKADSRGYRMGDGHAHPGFLKRYWHFDQNTNLTIYTYRVAEQCYTAATGKLSFSAYNPRVVNIVNERRGFPDFYHVSVADGAVLRAKNKYEPDCDVYGYNCTYVEYIDEEYMRATDIGSVEDLATCVGG